MVDFGQEINIAYLPSPVATYTDQPDPKSVSVWWFGVLRHPGLVGIGENFGRAKIPGTAIQQSVGCLSMEELEFQGDGMAWNFHCWERTATTHASASATHAN